MMSIHHHLVTRAYVCIRANNAVIETAKFNAKFKINCFNECFPLVITCLSLIPSPILITRNYNRNELSNDPNHHTLINSKFKRVGCFTSLSSNPSPILITRNYNRNRLSSDPNPNCSVSENPKFKYKTEYDHEERSRIKNAFHKKRVAMHKLRKGGVKLGYHGYKKPPNQGKPLAEFDHVFRAFLNKVHPDRWNGIGYTEYRSLNQASLQELNSFIGSFKGSKGNSGGAECGFNHSNKSTTTTASMYPPIQELNLRFVVQLDSSLRRFKAVEFKARTSGGDCSNHVARSFGQLFHESGLPREFVWGDKYWFKKSL